MTRLNACAFIIVGALSAGASNADDTVGRATPTDHQSLKTCIEKQKTADVTMSKSAMMRICKQELKRQKELGESTPPPSEAPNNR